MQREKPMCPSTLVKRDKHNVQSEKAESKTSLPFRKWLRDRRETLGLTQMELAQAAGVSPSTLNKLELGIHQPSTANLRKLVPVLRVTREQIMAAARGEQVELDLPAPRRASVPPDVAARLEAMSARMSIPVEELLRMACDVIQRVYRR
jgi:transcriptional regulator with XRE-family HTH domain